MTPRAEGHVSPQRAVLTTGAATLIGNAAALLLPFVLARWTDDHQATDELFLILSTGTAIVLLLSLAIEGSLLPVAVSARAKGGTTLADLSRKVLYQSGLLGLGLGVLATVLSIVLVRATLDPADGRRALATAILLAPLPLFIAINSALTALLASMERFAAPPLTLLLRSAVPVCLAAIGPDYLVTILAAGGLVVGEAARAGLLMHRLRTCLAGEMRAAASSSVHLGKPLMQVFWSTATPQLVSNAFVVAIPLVDRAFAASTGAGGVTAFELGDRATYVYLVLFNSAVAPMAAVRWARLVTRKDDAGLRYDYNRTQSRVFLAAAGLGSCGLAASWVLGGHIGQIASVSPDEFRWILVAFTVGMPFAVYHNLAARLFTCLGDTRPLILLAAGSLTVNTVLNWSLVGPFGVIGVCAATSGMRCWLVVMDRRLLNRRLDARRLANLRDADPVEAC